MPRFDESFLADVRARVPISSLIGQRVTWDRKKTRTNRGDYWACCPFHGEKGASFHCEDKKGRYHCFGCGASGDHFRFLREMDGCSFMRAVEIVADMAGLRLPNSPGETEAEKAERAKRAKARALGEAKRREQEERDKARRVKGVKEIWQETKPFAGSLADTYLEWRYPGLSKHVDPDVVRFHPGIEHRDVPGLHPALIARVQDVDGKGVGIWRIYLAADGRGKLAVPKESSAKLGLGPTAGAAVRMNGIAPQIGICEGIESGLAARELGIGYPIWPCLSTSGIVGFKIPEGVDRIVVYADPDGDKIKTRQDGRIQHQPGLIAYHKFRENNPGRDIRLAPSDERKDLLETLQSLKGHPIR